MSDFRPFKGLRYNLEKTGDLSSVITPPYDIISSRQQHAYYEKSPYSMIRLELGKQFPDDTPQNNRYTRTAQTLEEWIHSRILLREERPAFYLMEHRFFHKGSYKSYWGLTGIVRLEEFDAGQIRATEITMASPIEDRLKLLNSCRTNFSPLMGAFIQEQGDLLTLIPNIDQQNPDVTGTDDSGIVFNLWVVDDDETVKRITHLLADRNIYIADGHHRYTTSLTYRKEQSDLDVNSADPRNFVMMTLISSNDRGLIMLPTHRLIKDLGPEQLDRLESKLPEYFRIEELPDSSGSEGDLQKWMDSLTEAGKEGAAFGLYGLRSGKCLLLTPHDVSSLYEMLPSNKPLVWRKLDVSLLHAIVIQEILGLDTPEKQKECLQYSPDEAEVIRKVDNGAGQLAILLNPAPISSVMAVADAGDRMPQKSTYFYPKTPAGLVMNPLF